MRKVTLVILLRLALLVALMASAALYVEYQNAGDPAFCGAGSGCMAVRLSPFSKLLGVPLPTIGLAVYAGLFVLSLTSQSRGQLRFQAFLNGLGALSACVLIYLQAFEIRAFCPWCVAVDTSAIVAAVCASLLYGQVADDREAITAASAELSSLSSRPAIPLAWVLAAAAAIGAPLLWGQYPVIPPLAPAIAALQVPGKVTIVSFTDFECPFCRALHPIIEKTLEEHPDRIALVRRMMPLQSHPGAMPAALAYACTPETKRPQIVDALYATPEPLLTRDGTIAVGAGLGLDREEFARCVDSPAARDEVERDMKLFTDLQAQALPLTYVGPRVILGFNPARFQRAVELALQGEQPSLPVRWMFVALGVIFAAAVGMTLRLSPRR